MFVCVFASCKHYIYDKTNVQFWFCLLYVSSFQWSRRQKKIVIVGNISIPNMSNTNKKLMDYIYASENEMKY